MEYISSDTNIWIDFVTIDKLDLPFRLPCTYLLSDLTMEDEVLRPESLSNDLVELGLEIVEVTTEIFKEADHLAEKYRHTSLYDCIALSIAKTKKCTLLTGDKNLRKAAQEEGVAIIGTLGILDRLQDENLIGKEEYQKCLQKLSDNNGEKIRLPEEELNKRITDRASYHGYLHKYADSELIKKEKDAGRLHVLNNREKYTPEGRAAELKK